EQQIGNAVKELLRLREFAHVGDHFGMPPGEMAKLLNEVRIGKEAHVEDEIGLEWDSVLVAEALGANQEAAAVRAALELVLNMSPELVNIEIRGVDENIGNVANGV